MTAPYPYPPLVSSDPAVLAARMAEHLGNVWDEVEAKRKEVLASANALRRVETLARLDELQTTVRQFQGVVLQEAEAFAKRAIPALYAQGAMTSASLSPFVWSQFHIDAAQSLAADSYADFLARSQEAGRTSEAFARNVREVARDRTAFAVTGNKTAVQVARDLEKRLGERGLSVVTYANGRNVSMRTYTQMAVRTKTAVAHNVGALNTAAEQGIRYVEVFDGTFCGWTGHADGDNANGSIRSVSEASRYPISHPNCRRAFGPRPDITSSAEARDAALSTTAAQRDDQATFEQALAGVRTPRPAPNRDAMTARRARRTVEADRDLLAGVDLTPYGDDALADLITNEAIANDEAALGRIFAELDRRDADGPPPAPAAPPTPPEQVDVAAALAKRQGDQTALERLAVEAFYRDMAARDAAAQVVQAPLPPAPRGGRNVKAHEEYELMRHNQMIEAENATGGLLNREALRRGITEYDLWDLPPERAVRFATEELLLWWQENPARRLSYSQFEKPNGIGRRIGERFAVAVRDQLGKGSLDEQQRRRR